MDGEVKKEVDGGEEKIGDEGEFVSNTHTHTHSHTPKHSPTHTHTAIGDEAENL